MQASLVAVGLQNVRGYCLAISHSVLICLAAPLNQSGKYCHNLDLVFEVWGFKTIHLLLLSPDCNSRVCTGFFPKLGHNLSGIHGAIAAQL